MTDLFTNTVLENFTDNLKVGSNTRRVMRLLVQHFEHPISTFEIMDTLFPSGRAGLFRLGAVIFNLKHRLEPLGYTISGQDDKEDPAKYWYQLEAI